MQWGLASKALEPRPAFTAYVDRATARQRRTVKSGENTAGVTLLLPNPDAGDLDLTRVRLPAW